MLTASEEWVMDAGELIRRFPTVFHMASASAWPSIQAHGLLSTEHLVDLYQVEGSQRELILLNKRSTAVTLHHPDLPSVTVRDQKPMKYIDQKIAPDSSLEQYLAAINQRVFFWASWDRLNRLRSARSIEISLRLCCMSTPPGCWPLMAARLSCADSTQGPSRR